MTQTADNLSSFDTPLMRHHLEHLRHCAASDLASGTEAFFRFLDGEVAIRATQATAKEIEKLLPDVRTPHSSDPLDKAHADGYNVCLSDIRTSIGLGASAPAKDEAAADSEEEVEEESAASGWRRLALQFDGQRMQALGHIRALLQDYDKHAAIAQAFVNGPPLSGEEVLAQRIAAIVAGADQCGAPLRSSDLFVDDAAIAGKWAAQVNFGNVSTATYFIRQAIAEFCQALVRQAASRSVAPRDGRKRLSIVDCIAQFRTYAAATPNADAQHALVFVADFLRDHGPLTASDEDIEDAGRYRWLASGWTTEELVEAERNGRQPAHTRQQDVVNHLAAWYLAKDQFDEIIDKFKNEKALS